MFGLFLSQGAFTRLSDIFIMASLSSFFLAVTLLSLVILARITLAPAVGVFAARAAPVAGQVLLAYDVGATLWNATIEYNRITSQ